MRFLLGQRGKACQRGRWEVEKIDKLEKGEKRIEEKKRPKVLGPTAQERCRAVLAVWTERRKPGEVCREIGVTLGVLTQWQERAIEGMLEALESRPKPIEEGMALSRRLAVLLEKKSQVRSTRLERRLTRLQEGLSGAEGVVEVAGEKKA